METLTCPSPRNAFSKSKFPTYGCPSGRSDRISNSTGRTSPGVGVIVTVGVADAVALAVIVAVAGGLGVLSGCGAAQPARTRNPHSAKHTVSFFKLFLPA